MLDLLGETCMLGLKPAGTPSELNQQLGSNGGEQVNKEMYQKWLEIDVLISYKAGYNLYSKLS